MRVLLIVLVLLGVSPSLQVYGFSSPPEQKPFSVDSNTNVLRDLHESLKLMSFIWERMVAQISIGRIRGFEKWGEDPVDVQIQEAALAKALSAPIEQTEEHLSMIVRRDDPVYYSTQSSTPTATPTPMPLTFGNASEYCNYHGWPVTVNYTITYQCGDATFNETEFANSTFADCPICNSTSFNSTNFNSTSFNSTNFNSTNLNFNSTNNNSTFGNYNSTNNGTCSLSCCNYTAVEFVPLCSCQPGWTSADCTQHEPIYCNFTLISPAFDCPVPPDQNSSCPKYSMYQNTPLLITYQVNCSFVAPVNYTFADYVDYFNNTQFSNVSVRLKFYNFKMFSDTSHTFYTNILDGYVLQGLSLFNFSVVLSNITGNPRFFPGGRLYFETFFRSSPAGLANRGVDRHFIDFYDAPGPLPRISSAQLTIILATVIPIVVLLIVGVIVYFMGWRKGWWKAKLE